MTTTVNPTPNPEQQPVRAVPPHPAPLVAVLLELDEAHRRFRHACGLAAGLGPTDLTAILALARHEPTTPRELAETCFLTSGATTALIDRLEDDGHLSRTPHPSDRRSSLLILTPSGRATVQQILDRYDTVLQHLPPTRTPGEYLAALTTALHLNADTNLA
jgi:DNA-binding MarR family transcriptional regulator